jgi:hypothetical protein
MATSTEREVVADYLTANELLAICRANGDPRALNAVRTRLREGCHSLSGADLDFRTERDGVAWHARKGPRGFLAWEDVWRIAAAGASRERVDALSSAYRAYVEHTASFVPCPRGPAGTRGRWWEEHGNAYHARYAELSAAITAAHRTIVTQPLVEQLDLFGDAA